MSETQFEKGNSSVANQRIMMISAADSADTERARDALIDPFVRLDIPSGAESLLQTSIYAEVPF
jgi:hypothetical protein